MKKQDFNFTSPFTNFLKNLINIRFNILGAFLFLILIPKILIAQDVYEPNETAGTATEMVASTNIGLSIHQIGDTDWFRFTATKNALLYVGLTFPIGNGTSDVELELYAANGTTMLTSSTTGDPRETITFPIVSGTSYLIRVYGAGGENVVNNYDMTVQELDTDAFESNNTVVIASLISPGNYSNLNIFNGSDVDYYRVHISASTQLSVEINLHPGNANHDLDMYLYNAVSDGLGGFTLGSLIGKSESSSYIELINSQVGIGDYLIKVAGYAGSTNVYSMRISAFQGPALPAIEVAAGETSIAATNPRMQALLNSVSAGGLSCTPNLTEGQTFAIGANTISWTVWQGTANNSPIAETGTAIILVLPYGQSPIGVAGPVDDSDYSRAISGNHGSNIVRDASGAIHVAWFDGENGRPYRIWYRRGVQDANSGEVTWTDPIDVANGAASYQSFIKIAASENAVHFAWGTTGTGNINYRRLLRTNAIWAFDAIQNTGLKGTNHDNGPDIAAFNDEEVHIVAANHADATHFDYGYKLASASAWVKESITIPAGAVGYKYPAISTDLNGEVHVVFTALYRNGAWPQTNPTSAGSYYWKMWYMHRTRPTVLVSGSWIESHNIFSQFSEWNDPGVTNGAPQDVAADWAHIRVDSAGNIFVAWHGTANTHWVGKDDAFVARRSVNNDGNANGWEQPIALHTAGNNLQYSWAPSLCVDGQSGTAFPVFFYKTLGTGVYDNYSDMDAAFRVMLNGKLVDGSMQPLTQMAALHVTTAFTSVSPTPYRDINGHAWLDVVHAMMPVGSGFAVIVYQRQEVSGAVTPTTITSQPTNATVFENQTAVFNVTAGGAHTLSYQWLKNGVAIAGANNSTYSTPNSTLADNGAVYAVSVSNAPSFPGSTPSIAISANATLTVAPAPIDTTAPSVPANLVASAITQTTLTLSWQASTDAVGVTGYNVFLDNSLIGTSVTTSTSILGLLANTTYTFKVSAFDAATNESVPSTELVVTTLPMPDTTAPTIPTNLSASAITQTSFNLSWVASTDDVGVTNYEVFRNGVSVGTTALTSYSLTGLIANTNYDISIRASDTAGNWSAESLILSIKTLNQPGLIKLCAKDQFGVEPIGVIVKIYIGGVWVNYNSGTSIQLTVGTTYSVQALVTGITGVTIKYKITNTMTEIVMPLWTVNLNAKDQNNDEVFGAEIRFNNIYYPISSKLTLPKNYKAAIYGRNLGVVGPYTYFTFTDGLTDVNPGFWKATLTAKDQYGADVIGAEIRLNNINYAVGTELTLPKGYKAAIYARNLAVQGPVQYFIFTTGLTDVNPGFWKATLQARDQNNADVLNAKVYINSVTGSPFLPGTSITLPKGYKASMRGWVPSLTGIYSYPIFTDGLTETSPAFQTFTVNCRDQNGAIVVDGLAYLAGVGASYFNDGAIVTVPTGIAINTRSRRGNLYADAYDKVTFTQTTTSFDAKFRSVTFNAYATDGTTLVPTGEIEIYNSVLPRFTNGTAQQLPYADIIRVRVRKNNVLIADVSNVAVSDSSTNITVMTTWVNP
jgi:chitodextrinase